MNLLSLGPGAGGLAAVGCFTLPCQGPASRLGTFRVISSGKMCTGTSGKFWKLEMINGYYIQLGFVFTDCTMVNDHLNYQLEELLL